MMHVVYQTKMGHDADFCRPSHINIQADTITEAINKMNNLMYKCFGDTVQHRIVAIVPPGSGAYLFGFDAIAGELVGKIV